MSDLISRQAAIDAIDNVDWYHQDRNKDMVLGANPPEHQAWYKEGDIYKAIENVPTIEERKTGRWVEVSDDVFASTFYCSVCREEPPTYEGQYELTRFCPYCGARMVRGEEHG